MVEHGPDPLGVDTQQLGDPLDRHLPLDQGHRQGFEEQGEATVWPRPGHLHRLDSPIAGLDARHLAVQVAGMLEEVQMLPGALVRVIDRTGLPLAIWKSAASRKAKHQVKFLPARRTRLEFNGVHLPRCVQAQGHTEKLFAVHGCRARVRVACPEFALETALAATALPTRFHQEPYFLCHDIRLGLIGIGRSLAAPPSHTTGRTGHVSGGSMN